MAIIGFIFKLKVYFGHYTFEVLLLTKTLNIYKLPVSRDFVGNEQ
jgi:hypothetical protein